MNYKMVQNSIKYVKAIINNEYNFMKKKKIKSGIKMMKYKIW